MSSEFQIPFVSFSAACRAAKQLPAALHQVARLIVIAAERSSAMEDALAFWDSTERQRALRDWGCGLPDHWLELRPGQASVAASQRLRRHYIRHQWRRCQRRLSAKFKDCIDLEPDWGHQQAAQWFGHVTSQESKRFLLHFCHVEATAQWLDIWNHQPPRRARIEHELRYLTASLP
ncbi:hypothetical protein HDE76_000013 [Rhodanobacter sp. ANJX3]|uniref:hypothetical protein n=1 Tax=Rhodanobacter sp. ANJX3 TaxID=2723083 RepID=UPI0016201FF8|nr:hypothetical protein [Rhodanobacter sp. ANJX3]MBB5356831.1 hypothetical protein [Rhodanobacter sp. ANJX3]